MMLFTIFARRLQTWRRVWLTPERLNWLIIIAMIGGGFLIVTS